jgi:hypothetical protein
MFCLGRPLVAGGPVAGHLCTRHRAVADAAPVKWILVLPRPPGGGPANPHSTGSVILEFSPDRLYLPTSVASIFGHNGRATDWTVL